MAAPKPNSKFDHAYAIVRFNWPFPSTTTDVENCITVKLILRDQAAALREVERLNVLHKDKRVHYFCQITRIERAT